jgi:maltose-binding protein MalE
MSDLLALGSDAYVQALEGVVNVAEAAQTLTEAVNAAYDLDTPSVDGATACELEGTVRVWHAWPNADTTGLRMIIQAFTRRCPGVHVDLVRVDDGALLAQYQDAIAQDQGPDLLLGSSAWVAELADEGLASPLTPLVGPDLLQRFRPEMLQALTYEEQLYGLPLALDVVALYQNTTLATETPRILDDLVALASPGQRVALPADFYHGFWGVAAHGGVSVGEGEDGELTLDAPGFVAWLEWLTAAQLTPGVVVDTETAALQRLFMDGGAAYWVGDASALYDVEAALGRDAVAVLPLPAGPVAEARPLLRVSGLLLNPTISQERAALAIAFATYMTNEESQARLMELLGHVPSNVSVSTAYRPAVAGFIEQAKQSLVPPDTVVRDELDEWGDALYAQALSTTKDLAELVEPFVRSFNAQTEAP